ncbi:unnamed protein product [Camellia sinensis]
MAPNPENPITLFIFSLPSSLSLPSLFVNSGSPKRPSLLMTTEWSHCKRKNLKNESSGLYTGDGSVNIKGEPVLKSNTGNWRACPFILHLSKCLHEGIGIATNLVTYLTTKLHEGNVSAARNVTTWSGTCYLTPFIGAVLADAYWGRYWTIAAFSTIYFI